MAFTTTVSYSLSQLSAQRERLAATGKVFLGLAQKNNWLGKECGFLHNQGLAAWRVTCRMPRQAELKEDRKETGQSWEARSDTLRWLKQQRLQFSLLQSGVATPRSAPSKPEVLQSKLSVALPH